MRLEYRFDDHREEIKSAEKSALMRVMESVGLHLEGEAADELENDPRRVDTGRLKGSITHTSSANEVIVGTNVEYAIYVHEGTRKMEPNRFLKNAFDRNMEQVKEYIVDELRNG